MPVHQRLIELQLELPPPPQPAGAYRATVIAGDWLITAGMLPFERNGTLTATGCLGDALDTTTGQRCARQAALTALAAINAACGLDAVQQIARVEGYVAAAPKFDQHAAVVDGASDLLAEVFGAAGRHSRIAVGCASLPLQAPVELVLWCRIAGSDRDGAA